MDKKEMYKDVDISDRKWRVSKFDARTGSYVLFKVMGILSPLLSGLKAKEDINFTQALSGLMSLSEDDFNYIQGKCLSVCSEVLPAGLAPVLNANGTYGVNEIEHDTVVVLALTVHALVFNVAGFFGENPLLSLQGMASGLFQQNAKT